MFGPMLLIVIFGGFVVGIWFSYRLFMRGDTNAERVASRLPPGFKADWSWRMGDTYVGYEKAGDRLALVDYPLGTVVSPSEVRSMEPMDDGMLGVVHRWIVVTVPREPPQMRIWFRFSPAKRAEILARLKALT
jgi:hypothetical protein